MVAARLATLTHGGDRSKASIEALTQSEAAASLNVSRSNVQRARQVIDSGTPELIQAVDEGTRHPP
jgi:hypothetical protein